jgi:hypothetical protein
MDMDRVMTLSIGSRKRILFALSSLMEKETKEGRSKGLELIYKLRTKIIAMCLTSKMVHGFKHLVNMNLDDHPGWIECSDVERVMLNQFELAINVCEKYGKLSCVKVFNDADKMFGKYRYQLWIEDSASRRPRESASETCSRNSERINK